MINSAIKQIALVVGSTLIAMAGVHAQTTCPDASVDTTVSSSCDTGISLSGANLTIGTPTGEPVEVSNPGNIVIKVIGTGNTIDNAVNGSIVETSYGIGIYNEGTINALTNSGLILTEEGGVGIDNRSTITTLTNVGSIVSVARAIGIQNYSVGANITTLTNSGTISVRAGGIGIYNGGTINTLTNTYTITTGDGGYGIFNSGTIDTLKNSGTITTGNGSTGITNYGTINNLNNSGTISALTNALGIFNDAGIIATLNNSGTIISGDFGGGIFNSNGGTINTLNNSGMISVGAEESAVYNYDGVITTLNNSGVITSGDRGYGINNSLRTIITLNNLGSITSGNGGWGIYNQDTIHTLSNAQGGNGSSPSTTALTYDGNLPTNYNIIINSATHYGQLATSGLSGVTTFGISPLRKNSTILNTTLTSVLSGVSADQLGLSGLSSFSGLSNGFSYTLYLMDLATNTWGLIVTACNNCDIYSGMSVSLSDIDVTVYPVLAGGTLVLNNGDNSGQAFAVTANSVITSPSTGTATLSGYFPDLAG